MSHPDDPPVCKVCGEEFFVKEECEDDGFCDGCAHDVADHASKNDIRRAKYRLRKRWGLSPIRKETNE